ncbi:hypothetical protein C8J56DRAFT_979495 [Mycena floridula]|nr:hypothetical protein C8J56DRAFT_979495 [Mycena floridula]
MVNPRKPGPGPPPMASRTNSTQPLVRSANKQREAGPNSSLKPKTSSVSSPLGLGSHKHKKRHQQPPKKKSLFDRLYGILIFSFIAYVVALCPSDSQLENPVCHSLAIGNHHILQPYILPPIYRVLHQPAVRPYVDKAVEFKQTVEPYINAVVARATPLALKANFIVWDSALVPTYQRFILPQYRGHIYPHISKISSQIDPYISPIREQLSEFATRTTFTVHRLYTTVQPHVHHTYVTVKPHAIRTYQTALPLAIRAGETSKAMSIHAYEVARPYVRLAYARTSFRARRLRRKLIRWRRLYVDKHLGKIWDKVEEFSGTSTLSPALTRSSETVASSIVSSTETTTVSVPAAEITTESVILSVSPADEVVLSSTETSTEEQTSSRTTVASETETVTESASGLSSASSILVESSIGTDSLPSIESTTDGTVTESASALSSASSILVESSVGTESIPSIDSTTDEETLTADEETLSSWPSSSSLVQDELLSASSVVAETKASSGHLAAASTIPRPSAEELEDTDLEDLISEIGFVEEPEEPVVAPESPVEPEQPLSAEEKAELRLKHTQEKRKDIVGRHERWTEQLNELSEQKQQAVRNMLIRVRKSAAKALWDKTEEPEVDAETSEEDKDTMLLVDGQRVSRLLDHVASEGERLIKGLELYLRKEEKTIKANAATDLEAKEQKWTNFVDRIEAKFSELVSTAQTSVRQWFIQVRDIEIRECLAASAEVKALADRAQTDLNLDYAWLDDVTYYDWQKYHDLARTYEHFDEQVRLLQNGTHPSPPADPVISALDKLQLELNDIIAGFNSKVRTINEKAFAQVFVSPEPQVSILPVVEVKEKGEVDPEQVVIGKSKVQVEAALKDIPVVHEEL